MKEVKVINTIFQRDEKGGYRNIEFYNCDIIKSPYCEGFIDANFFITKRKGFKIKYEIPEFEFTDIYQSDSGTYFLAVKNDKTKIRVYKEVNGNLVLMSEDNFLPGMYEKFIIFDFVKGRPISIFQNQEIYISSFGKQINESNGVSKFQDTNHNFNFNPEIQGAFIYVFGYRNNPILPTDGLAGQVNIIGQVYNDQNPKFFTVVNPWYLVGNLSTGENVKYMILPDWGEVFGYVCTKGIKTWAYDNNTTGSAFFIEHEQSNVSGANLSNYIKAVETYKGAIFMLDKNNKIFHSFQGMLKMLFRATDYYESPKEVDSIATFQDYLLLMSKRHIDALKGEIETVNNKPTWDIKYYTLLNEVGLRDKYSYMSYLNQFYFLATDNRFYALSIQPTTTEKLIPRLESQNEDIPKFLSSFAGGNADVFADSERIYLFLYSPTKTTIFVYDKTYNIWLTWNIEGQKIVGINPGVKLFYGGKIYSLEGYYDGNSSYKQRVSFYIGNDDLGIYKYFYYLKLIFGSPFFVSNNTKLKIKYRAKNKFLTREFINLNQFFDQLVSQNTFGGDIVGGEIIGGDYSENIEEYMFSSKFSLNIISDLIQVKLEAAGDDFFSLGGFYVILNYINPDREQINNIYILNK